MFNSLYPKLAAQNIKKNGRYYFPYIISGILSVAMFYIILSFNRSESLQNVVGGATLESIFLCATVVGGILFAIFLFYNQSFLIKHRKTEFGLYSVLGMEKKHISVMCAYESLYVTSICVFGGIAVGVLFSKLVFLALLKILAVSIPLKFEIDAGAISGTAAMFLVIYTLIFFNTVRQIYMSKTVELLHSSKVGEKEPKAKWFVTLLGLLTLGAGYAIALTTKSPLNAIPLFTLAVILVIIGTYCLFTSGSISLLKMLRKNKDYYYKTKHFVNVSGMIYRMKQNAVGLGNICIFCTAVLVMISTTFSLYAGMEDVLRNRFPRNISTEIYISDDGQAQQINDKVVEITDKYGVGRSNILNYKTSELTAVQVEPDRFSATDADQNSVSFANEFSYIKFVSLEDYNRAAGKKETLSENEVLLCEVNGKIEGDRVRFGDYSLDIKQRVDDFEPANGNRALMLHTFYIIIPDESVISQVVKCASAGETDFYRSSYYCGFDTDADANTQILCTNELQSEFVNMGYAKARVECAEESRNSFYSLYGGLLFIGIFLGLAFIIATVLIIYYKQISEGRDDKDRFDIMQKVGLSKQEIKKTINSQVLTVFFLPLLVSFVHLAVAFPILTKLLAMLMLTNKTLFLGCTVASAAVFTLFYIAIYVITSKIYYKIVN